MVLVTGGTGLVGSHLLYKLAVENTTIRAIYRTKNSLKNVKHVFSYYTENFEELFSKIEWVNAHLNDISGLDIAFKNITHVYHCAALISFDPKDFYLLEKTNKIGTANIVNLCISNSIEKLCYVSSIATLGSKLNKTIITEDNHWNDEDTNSVYAITKYSSELEVWRGTQEGLNAVIINPGVIIGPGFWDSGTGELFKKIHQGFKYTTNGSIGLVAVNDVVNVLLLAMKSSISEKRYIAISENKSYYETFSLIAKALDVKPPTKIISTKTLQILWRLDWLKSNLFFQKRRLTKALAKSLTNTKTYNNELIKKDLNYTFESTGKSIKDIAELYLKDLN